MATELIFGFNGGETSRNIESRLDLPLYRRGASIIENFDVQTEGGVRNRGGTKFLGLTKGQAVAGDSPCYFLPFSFSDEFSYQLEMGEQYMRIWNVQTQAIIQTIDTDVPYALADIPNIQFHRSFNVMYMAHGSYPLRALTRTGIASFLFEIAGFEFPPMLEQNVTDIQLYLDAQRGTDVPIYADGGSPFNPSMVGAYFEIKQERQNAWDGGGTDTQYGSSVQWSGFGAGANQSDPLFAAFSKWRLRTTGTWRGRLSVEITYDGFDLVEAGLATWESLHIVGDTTNGVAENFTFDFVNRPNANAFLRINYVGQDGSCGGSLYVDEVYNYGLVQMTGYISPTEMRCDVLSDLYRQDGTTTYATKYWSEGAFSANSGYPRTVTIYEDRLWLCGTDAEPCTLWGSVTDDWTNFLTGTLADEGIRRIPPVNGAAAWMEAKENLFLCTDTELMLVASTNSNEGLSPNNLRFIVQNGFGGAYRPNVISNDVIVFVDKGRKKTREVIYNDGEANFRSNDLSALAKHITQQRIIQQAIQKLPDQRINYVLENGQLGVLTHERTEEVVAWQRYVTDGNFISASAAQDGEKDALWYCIERNGVYMVEAQIVRDEDTEWFLDSAVEKLAGVDCQIAESIVIGPDPTYEIIITKEDHGLVDTDLVRFEDVTGYDYLEGNIFQVTSATADTFVLADEFGVVIDPNSFNLDYIDVIDGGTELVNGRYFPDAEYGTPAKQGFSKITGIDTYVVQSPIPANKYAQYVTYAPPNSTEGVTDQGVLLGGGSGALDFYIELEISTTLNPINSTIVFGRPTENGMASLTTASAAFEFKTITVEGDTNIQTFFGVGGYDNTGTKHKYKLERDGDTLKIFYDGAEIVAQRKTINPAHTFNNNLVQYLNVNGDGGRYTVHSIVCASGTNDLITLDLQEQTQSDQTWFDLSVYGADMDLTNESWANQGLIGTTPGWAIGRYYPIFYNLYVPSFPALESEGVTDSSIDFGSSNFTIEVQLSADGVIPQEDIFGSGPVFGSIDLYSISGKLSWRLVDENVQQTLHTILTDYPTDGSIHTYKIVRAGDDISVFYDGVQSGSTSSVAAGAVYNSALQRINQGKDGGNYTLHSIQVEIQGTVVLDYSAQEPIGTIWYDQSSFGNNMNFDKTPAPYDDWLDVGTFQTPDGELDGRNYDSYYENPLNLNVPPNDGWVRVSQGEEPPPTIVWPPEFYYFDGPISGTFCKVFNTVENLGHLIGYETAVVLDEDRVAVYTIEEATLLLEEKTSVALVGIPFASTVSPLPIESVEATFSSGRQKSVVEASLKLKDSLGGSYGSDLANMQPITTRVLEDPIGIQEPLVNADLTVYAIDQWEKTKRLFIQQTQPFKFELLSISMDVRAKGR